MRYNTGKEEPELAPTRTTAYFNEWIGDLRDKEARRRILARITRLRLGNPGDHKDFGDISELRIDYGPGYRVYYSWQEATLIILLAGGTKARQNRDFKTARELLVFVRKETGR
jgi:putative addiction module killer protein